MSKIKIRVAVAVLLLCFFSLWILIRSLIDLHHHSQNLNQVLAKTTESSLVPTLNEQNNDQNGEISILESIKSCSDAMEILPSPRSTKQWIYPHGNGNSTKVEVLCDFKVDGGGWTVIQKRTSGPLEDFNRTWTEYSNGFGSLDGNFWLGLDNIHALTKNGDQELRIELEDFEGGKAWAKYSNFSISDASNFYRLEISGFSGNSTAGDMMTNPSPTYGSNVNLSGMRFSTWDKDNDLSDSSCVRNYGGGGWWFNKCGYSNLNGAYKEKGETHDVRWYSWKGSVNSLAKTEMKIRTRKFESELE